MGRVLAPWALAGAIWLSWAGKGSGPHLVKCLREELAVGLGACQAGSLSGWEVAGQGQVQGVLGRHGQLFPGRSVSLPGGCV